MALACDAYGGVLTVANYSAAMKGASCQKICPTTPPVTPDEFRAGVLAGLTSALATKGRPVVIGSIDPNDIETAVKNLHCAVYGSGLSFQNFNDDKFNSLVLYLVNQLVCP